MLLSELDKEWDGQNVDKASIKLLCRKYSPQLLMDWIHRGLTVKKDGLIEWHKVKLSDLGSPVVEPEELPQEGNKNLAEGFGDYFSEE